MYTWVQCSFCPKSYKARASIGQMFSTEVERTRKSVSVIDDDQIKIKINECSEKTGIPLEMTMPIHRTRSSAIAEDSINNMISDLNAYMKRKIEKEFQIRFDSKNIQIMKAFEALDASKPCYLDIDTLDYLVQHFDCLGINRSVLKLELLRATDDFQKRLPISEKRSPNLIKLVNLKKTIATSTASVERSFSAMNRVCTKLRSRLTPSRLGDLVCITLNQDLASKIDIDILIDSWAAKGNRRVNV